MTGQDESALLQRAQSGEAQALEQLLLRYQGQLYRFSMGMCRHPEDAREVLQESLLAAARNLQSFRGDASLSSWLYAIARSFCVKQRRRARVSDQATPLDAAPLLDPAPAPDERAQHRQLLSELQDAIAALDPGYREVLLLRDVEGLRAVEVAQALEMTVPQVKSRLHRARVAVRERLDRRLREDHPRPEGPQPADCPDIATTFSRYLEGEINPGLCEEMQNHIDACPHCRATCDTLKHTLAICHAVPTPSVPADVQQAIRRELKKLLSRDPP